MKTISLYYLILAVYVSLWACQLIAGHLTHSLIILTDSYINLYRILDVSLGILHLYTQRQLMRHRELRLIDGAAKPEPGQLQQQHQHRQPTGKPSLSQATLAGRFFDCVCTYQFKRLPLLGSFVNGLFLAAFLMSAAIEGIQTCFHVGHSQGANEADSILKRDPLTYPLMLVGFALVGLVMQHCSLKAHQMREEELLSESLLDLSHRAQDRFRPDSSLCKSVQLTQLNATELQTQGEAAKLAGSSSSSSMSLSSGHRRSYDFTPGPDSGASVGHGQSSSRARRNSVVKREIAHDAEARISLKSLTFATNLESIVPVIESDAHESQVPPGREPKDPRCDLWFIVRYLCSPAALVACAAIVYFVPDDLATEILDAVLSVTVVVLLFAASYPAMKKAGRVLLQTAPPGVDPVELEKSLLSSSAQVLEVLNLRVWSLTPRSNRVATCQLLLDEASVTSEQQIHQILKEAKFRLLDHRIRCTTIEPIFNRDQADSLDNSESASHAVAKAKATPTPTASPSQGHECV